jgi:hypothetical protein
MSQRDSKELERLLAARPSADLPGELRGRVLAGIRHVLSEPAHSEPAFLGYALLVAASILLVGNVLLSLLDSSFSVRSQPYPIHPIAPVQMSGSLPSGIAERDLQQLAFLQSIRNSGSIRPPLLTAGALRTLLNTESSK